MTAKIQSVLHEDTHYQKSALDMRTQRCFAIRSGLNGINIHTHVVRHTYDHIYAWIPTCTCMYVGTCWKQSIGCREQWRAHFIKINALVRWSVLFVLSTLSSDWLVGLGAYGWWNHDGAGNSDVLAIICHTPVHLFSWHKIMSCHDKCYKRSLCFTEDGTSEGLKVPASSNITVFQQTACAITHLYLL